MKVRTLLAIFLVALVLLFAAVNFETFTRPTGLNLLFARIDAPLGVIMLGIVGVFTVLYLFLVVRVEIQGMFAERSHRRELERASNIANNEEASRLAKLTETVEREFAVLRKSTEEAVLAAREASRAARGAAESGAPRPRESAPPER